jgi:hypothetical protein
MKRSSFYFFAFVVVGLLTLILASPNKAAADPVSDANLIWHQQNLSSYVGRCPQTFSFHGRFHIEYPNQAVVSFEHSDGSKSRDEVLSTSRSPMISVGNFVHHWSINKSGNYWIKMHVSSGNTKITSETIPFSVQCK